MFSYTVYFLYCSLSISFTFTNKSTSLKCWVHVWDCRVISNIKILTALWFQWMHELIKHLPWLNTMQVALFRSICQMHKSTAYLDGKMLGEKQHMWEKKIRGLITLLERVVHIIVFCDLFWISWHDLKSMGSYQLV